MKVKVNQDNCIGCGLCVSNAEDLFEFNDKGISVVKVDTVPEDKQDEAKEAIEGCPVSAIEEV